MNLDRYYPTGGQKGKWYPTNVLDSGLPLETGTIWFVDGDKSASGNGRRWESAFTTVEEAANAVSAGDVIKVAAKTMAATDTDPSSYTENVVLDVPQVSLIGVSRGLTQGGLPQLKVGDTTTSPVISVKAPGVLIANIGINGSGGTGGGIKFFDDGGTTYTSFGGTVAGCHLKNCIGPDADDATEGGAVQLSGAPWQIRIEGNRFYKNVGDVVLLDTSNSAPQDVVIANNYFSDSPASTDCNIYGAGGSGFGTGLLINNNTFGALPAIGANVARYLDLTGADGGMMTRNMFGCLSAEGETEVTFEASGTAAKIPTTVFMAGNFGQFSTGVGAGLISGEIFA